MFDVRFYSHLDVIEWLFQDFRLRVNEMRVVLDLFQSKIAVRVPYFEFKFFVRSISCTKPLFAQRAPYQRGEFIREPFAITNKNRENLDRFCKKMQGLKILDRVYGSSTVPQHRRNYSPTQLASQTYFEILSKDKESIEKIHDAVEAIEALFTPEKFVTKAFITRVTNLVKLLGVDPNDTRALLQEAWEVRSEFSHHGKGWPDEEAPKETLEMDEESNREIIEKEDRLRRLSQLLVNYLRICVVVRLLSNVTDRDFIRLLKTDYGQRELAPSLEGLAFLTSGDPLIALRRPTRARLHHF